MTRPKLSKKAITYIVTGSIIVIIVLLNVLQFVEGFSLYSRISQTFNNNRKFQSPDHEQLNDSLRKFSQECQKNNYQFESDSTGLEKPFAFDHNIFNKEDESERYETITFIDLNPKSEQEASKFKFSYQSPVLVLSSVTDENSYGNAAVRSFKNFLNMLNKINYPKSQVTLGLSVKSPKEFRKLKSLVSDYYNSPNLVEFFQDVEKQDNLFQKRHSDDPNYRGKFRKIVLVHAPFIENSFKIDRDTRHDLAIQKRRRSVIAKVRNFLLNTVLTNEKYTLFIDSDIFELPFNMVNYFIKSNKDVVVPRIQKGDYCFDYDQNSWVGERTQPTKEEFAKLNYNKQLKMKKKKEEAGIVDDDTDIEAENTTLVKANSENGTPFFETQEEFTYVPNRAKNSKLLIMLSRNLEINSEEAFHYFTPIDSVGGAVLFVKSIIFKQGIQFPPLYIVGTDWNRIEGYDGIETEGLCYQALILGYQCWGAPDIVAQHFDS